MTPAARVAAAAAALIVLWVVLPIKLPDNAAGLSAEACLTLADGEATASIAELTQCAIQSPVDVELLADLAAAHQQAGHGTDAEGVYRQILTIDPDYADVHVRLATLLLQRGAAAEAKAHLEAALRIQPNRHSITALLQRANASLR